MHHMPLLENGIIMTFPTSFGGRYYDGQMGNCTRMQASWNTQRKYRTIVSQVH